jgi:hypothetical protein
MQRARDRIKAITAPRYRLREPVQSLVDGVNRLLRGWGTYFRIGNASRQFQQVDDYVCQRLVLFLSKKMGRRGRQWGRYSEAVYRALGVYQLSGTVGWYRATPTAAR